MYTIAALTSKGHALRRQKKEEEKELRKSKGRGAGKRKMDEEEVRQIANEMGATVGGAAAEEVNGYRQNVDDLAGPATARQGPPAKVPKANAAQVPGAPPPAHPQATAQAKNDAPPAFDWGKMAGVSITNLINHMITNKISRNLNKNILERKFLDIYTHPTRSYFFCV